MWKQQQVVVDNTTAGNATTDTNTDTDIDIDIDIDIDTDTDDDDDDTNIMELETTPATTDWWWQWTILFLLLLLLLLLLLPPAIEEGDEVIKIKDIHHHRNHLIFYSFGSSCFDSFIERIISYVPCPIVTVSIRIMIWYDIVL